DPYSRFCSAPLGIGPHPPGFPQHIPFLEEPFLPCEKCNIPSRHLYPLPRCSFPLANWIWPKRCFPLRDGSPVPASPFHGNSSIVQFPSPYIPFPCHLTPAPYRYIFPHVGHKY